MKRKIDFDEIFRSCVVGRYTRSMTADEIELNKFTRACHKLINLYFKYDIYFKYADKTIERGFSKEELLRLYNKRLSKKKTTARHYYDMLLRFSPANKCQLCYIGQSESLDHFLPKDLFPSLSISSRNLIPVCGVCNQTKSDYIALVAEKQLLHPRYGQFSHRFSLVANFDTATNTVVFDVNDQDYHSSSIEYKRIEFHVQKFGIKTAFEGKAMGMLRDFVRLAVATESNIEDIINQRIVLLKKRFDEYNASKFTIYQWQWLTCAALLKSPYFLQNAKEIFGPRRDIYLPDYDFD